ncbi:MAG: phosphatase PAP2 family protein [Chthoniobacterales bacterium]
MSRGKTLLSVAITAAALGCAAAFYFDAGVISWVASHQDAGLRRAMKAVSRWGDWPLHVTLGLAAAGIAYLGGSRRWMRIFLTMVVACAIAGGFARVVKISTGRARPSVQTDAGWNGPRLGSKHHAFPSGHVAASSAFFGVLTFACWRAGAALLLIPGLIAFSRMYIGAHHFSDVVCAAVLGLICAWLVSRSRLIPVE